MIQPIERPDPNRRKTLLLVGGAAGAAAVGLAGTQLLHFPEAYAATVLTPTTTEGPFFVDEHLQRSDIRDDRAGFPLHLGISILQIQADQTLAPLAGAQVDIWHCDADGQYSDVDGNIANTCGQRFLRGYQLSNGNGVVRFKSIFPGSYPGRTVHIHCNIRTFDQSGQPRSEHQTQLFFRESIIARVYARNPYLQHAAARTTYNRTDGILHQVVNRSLLFARATLKPQRVLAAAHLIIDPGDAGHNAGVSTGCGA